MPRLLLGRREWGESGKGDPAWEQAWPHLQHRQAKTRAMLKVRQMFLKMVPTLTTTDPL